MVARVRAAMAARPLTRNGCRELGPEGISAQQLLLPGGLRPRAARGRVEFDAASLGRGILGALATTPSLDALKPMGSVRTAFNLFAGVNSGGGLGGGRSRARAQDDNAA